ncbi:hypothetical protein [uncultured Sphingomonas sp.]|uniref:hypothetical protein n=1 Tax=uncultured Sphingomonas sp. TaxID=158754 RepID=UPI0026323591|nr:hypothetical protein [uncultured Sphingomonas sp.]
MAVYNVSSAARELRPAFEGVIGEQWRAPGCESDKLSRCPEILAGWFQWALRDAVAHAGYYKTAGTAAAFYTRLADEIDTACAAKKLDCLASRSTLAPPFRSDYVSGSVARVPVLIQTYWRDGLHVAPQNYSVEHVGESVTDPEKVMRVADFVGSAKPTAQQATWSRLATESRNRAIGRLVSLISTIYAWVFLVMLLASPVGFSLYVRRAKSAHEWALVALVSACWVAVFSRTALLTYLDVTSIPSINVLYASPASPLLALAVVVSAMGLMPRPSKQPQSL